MTGTLGRGIILHGDLALRARLYRFLGVGSGGASASCSNMEDEQRSLAIVGDNEGVALLLCLLELAEVPRLILEGEVRLLQFIRKNIPLPPERYEEEEGKEYRKEEFHVGKI